MKHRLLIIFLMLTAVPLLLNVTTVQQSNKAELLTYLKNIKIIIEKGLQKLSHTQKELQQIIPQEYIIITNFLDDFFNTTEITQKYSKLREIEFYHICHEIKPINTFFDNLDSLNKKSFNAIMEEKINSLFSSDNSIDKKFLIVFCQDVGYIIFKQKILVALLQDIENKINELEAQI